MIYDRQEPFAHHDEDEPLLEELRDLVCRGDPVPREVVQLAEAAIQFRDLDTRLAAPMDETPVSSGDGQTSSGAVVPLFGLL